MQRNCSTNLFNCGWYAEVVVAVIPKRNSACCQMLDVIKTHVWTLDWPYRGSDVEGNLVSCTEVARFGPSEDILSYSWTQLTFSYNCQLCLAQGMCKQMNRLEDLLPPVLCQ